MGLLLRNRTAWRASLAAPAVAIVAAVSVGCGGTADNPARSASPTATASPTTSAAATGTTSARAGGLDRQYGVRYCEVLTVTLGETTKAEVWGTQGLNDCPQAAFASIDPAAIRSEMGVTAVMPNGPRYWVLDDVVAHQIAGSGQIREFGGIKMRSIATVDLGKGLPDRSPYKQISVKRDTEFRFDAGRTVYELTAPDGATYVMQSYSLEIDPSLTADSLAGLKTKLMLPTGWTYAARTLTEPLVVEDFEGTATVVQDELRNTYQLRTRT